MSERHKRESLLLGAIVGAIAAFAIVVPLSLLAFTGGNESDVASTQSAAATATDSGQQGNGGPGNGRGGPPEGRGPGSGTDHANESPTSQGVASPEVLDAFDAGGCVACHFIKGVGGEAAELGPNLSRIGVNAAERRPGASAEAYIEESIRDPNVFIMPNCPNGSCPAGVMPQTFADTLTASEISTIVNYLAALGTAAEADVIAEP